jgi:hypothetical protein
MDEASGTTMADAVADHNGTATDVETALPGRTGRVYGFDGTSSYVSVPSASALNPGSRDVRLSLAQDHQQAGPAGLGPAPAGYSARSTSLFKVEYQPTGRASCGFAAADDDPEDH